MTSQKPSPNSPGDYHMIINPFNSGSAESEDRSPKYNECLPNTTTTQNPKPPSNPSSSKPNNRFYSEFYSSPLRTQSLSSILLTSKHTHSVSLTKD